MALLACAWVGIRTAHAEDDDGRKRVVVLQFSGPQGARVHGAVVAGLERQVTVVDSDEFGEVLASAEGPTRPDRIAAACRELNVDAAVEGAMRRAGRVWSVEIFVRDCDNGEKIVPAGRATFSMRNLGGIAAIRGGIWGRIGEAILGAGGGSGGSTRVAAAPPRLPARPAGARGTAPAPSPAPASRPAPSARRANDMETCTFEEDEPPEGFPGYGDWVRRRNAFLNRCAVEREQRAQQALRQREEAARRAREEAREQARRAAEEERRRRDELERTRRADERRREREEEERRAAVEAARRRRQEEERAEERRQREEEARLVAERRRREEEEAAEVERRRDRRRRDEELERDVAAYRARLEREQRAAVEEPDYDDRRREEVRYEDEDPPAEDEPRYEDEEGGRRSRRESRRRYEEDEGASYDEGSDEDPVYDPEREDDEGDRDERRADDEEDPRGDDEEGEQDGPSPRRTGQTPTVLHIGAGIGFVNRQMTVAVEGSSTPRSYAAPGYPELSVSAQFFPGALTKNPGTIGGLGVTGLFRRHLFLQTSGVDATTQEAIDIPTAEQELAGGVIFRAPMGSGPKSPVFSISVAYGYFQFLLDPTQMLRLDSSMQMPTMTYVNIIGEAGVAIPLDDRGLAVELGATYRYVLDVGQAARDIFGADTKGGYAFGGHVALGGEAAFIARGIVWSISAAALIFNTEFSGASDADGGRIGGFPSGSDRYLRGVAMVGYRFR